MPRGLSRWKSVFVVLLLVVLGGGAAGETPPPQFDFIPSRVTNQNRQHIGAMFGGWGPHLRPIVIDSPDLQWMVTDYGPDVLHNTALFLHQFKDGSWNKISTLGMDGTIQQNMAVVNSGNTIFAYGVDVVRRRLHECYFSKVNPQLKACNHILVSGVPFTVAANSNYIGAAVAPESGTRVVWYTTVGVPGGGSVHYLFNSGGGWNGPFQVSLGGWGDLEYVYSSFLDKQRMAFAGQLFYGYSPNGNYATGYGQIKLGNSIGISTPLATELGQKRSTEDVWVDPVSRSVHILTRTFGARHEVQYFFKPWDAPWNGYRAAVFSIENGFRARFLFVPETGGLFVLVGAANVTPSRPALEAIYFDPATLASGKPLELNSASFRQAIPLGEIGLSLPSAIYVSGQNYQKHPLTSSSFAICGEYPAKGHEIWNYNVRVRP